MQRDVTTGAVLINMHTGNAQLGIYVIVLPPIPETAAQVNAAFGHNLQLFLIVACRLVVKRCVRAAPEPQAPIFSYQPSHHSPTHREIHTCTINNTFCSLASQTRPAFVHLSYLTFSCCDLNMELAACRENLCLCFSSSVCV